MKEHREASPPKGRARRIPGRHWKNVTIPEPLFEEIRDRADSEGVSISLVAQKAITLFLRETKTAS